MVERKRKTMVRTVVIMAMMLGAVTLVTPSTVKADWVQYTELTRTPYEIYIGQGTEFTFKLTNEKSETIQVTDFDVHFDWMSEGFAYDLLDSTIAIAPEESHTFSRFIDVPQIVPGSHTATITILGQAVSDWWDTSGTWVVSYMAKDVPELTVVVSANPNSGDAPLVVSFKSTVDGGIWPYIYTWSFGDGGVSDRANPTHEYKLPGIFTAKLIVFDQSSQCKYDQVVIGVSKPILPLTVDLGADTNYGHAPLTVQFVSQVFGGKYPYTYYWSFGDGGVSHVQNPIHTYGKEGTYTAKLVVTDSDGNTKSEKVTITTWSALPSIGALTFEPAIILCVGASMILIAIVAACLIMVKGKKDEGKKA